jgi:hypothetical protein
MPSVTDFPARGKIIAMHDRTVVFALASTNYEMRLEAEGSMAAAQVGVVIEALIRAEARKVWTVPSGGNFIEPIFGPPRRIQGRILYLDEQRMVVQAGAPIVIALPADPAAYDLARGPLAIGVLVNISALPGATFELLNEAAVK